MTAIYKKELKSYLTSMIGYLFMAFTLALFGLYFTAINLQQGYPEIGYALQNSAFILLIAVPVLTMRVLSEEQKNKTDQLDSLSKYQTPCLCVPLPCKPALNAH